MPRYLNQTPKAD